MAIQEQLLRSLAQDDAADRRRVCRVREGTAYLEAAPRAGSRQSGAGHCEGRKPVPEKLWPTPESWRVGAPKRVSGAVRAQSRPKWPSPATSAPRASRTCLDRLPGCSIKVLPRDRRLLTVATI